MSDVERRVRSIVRGVASFAEEMRAKGIHVGMGQVPRCVCCGEPWPCSTERKADTPAETETRP